MRTNSVDILIVINLLNACVLARAALIPRPNYLRHAQAWTLNTTTNGGVCSGECTCDVEQDQTCDGDVLLRTFNIDGCGCCSVCPRQIGQDCSKRYPCDESRSLACRQQAGSTSIATICQREQVDASDADGRGSCVVGDVSYEDGEQFMLDCGTRCNCENGTYGCVSLCPHELIRPSRQCHDPLLVQINSHTCCKEWLCQNTQSTDYDEEDEGSNAGKCTYKESEWSPCSVSCGVGSSVRTSNKNRKCKVVTKRRICEVVPCPYISTHLHLPEKRSQLQARHHHDCWLSHRLTNFVHLKSDMDSGCISVKKYRPRYCGICKAMEPNTKFKRCIPQNSITINVLFTCPSTTSSSNSSTEISQELKVQKYMWIKKCRCFITD